MEGGMGDVPARRFQSMDDSALSRISDVTASQEAMKEMARETGGIAYVNQNEIKQGVALAMDDSLAYYTDRILPGRQEMGWEVPFNKNQSESRWHGCAIP